MNDEELFTFLTIVERILNDRPLTSVGNDPKDLQALSPSALLLGRLDSDMPADTFIASDGYRRSWRLVNWLANRFWQRWLKEYLPTLQVRQKWLHPKRNLAVGDLCLLIDETQPRGVWPKALIEEAYPDANGIVRTVRIRTSTSSYTHDIRKLCLLEASD